MISNPYQPASEDIEFQAKTAHIRHGKNTTIACPLCYPKRRGHWFRNP